MLATSKSPHYFFLLILAIMPILSCSGQRPANLGITDNKFTACPSTPNCISSDANDDAHRTLPIQFNISATEAWQLAVESVMALPRTHIVTNTPNYLHAECTSALFRFVDDLELHLRPTDKTIAIRSASRLGHSDLGVNRDRVETLRTSLSKLVLIER